MLTVSFSDTYLPSLFLLFTSWTLWLTASFVLNCTNARTAVSPVTILSASSWSFLMRLEFTWKQTLHIHSNIRRIKAKYIVTIYSRLISLVFLEHLIAYKFFLLRNQYVPFKVRNKTRPKCLCESIGSIP